MGLSFSSNSFDLKKIKYDKELSQLLTSKNGIYKQTEFCLYLLCTQERCVDFTAANSTNVTFYNQSKLVNLLCLLFMVLSFSSSFLDFLNFFYLSYSINTWKLNLKKFNSSIFCFTFQLQNRFWATWKLIQIFLIFNNISM